MKKSYKQFAALLMTAALTCSGISAYAIEDAPETATVMTVETPDDALASETADASEAMETEAVAETTTDQTIPETEPQIAETEALEVPETDEISLMSDKVTANNLYLLSSDTTKGTYRMILTGVTPTDGADITQVNMVVYSQANGSDDLKVYKASRGGSNWYVTIDLDNHNFDAGAYTVSAYAYDSKGVHNLVKTATFTAAPAAENQIKCAIDKTQSTVTMTLRNAVLPEDCRYVSAPVWGLPNGTNDIKWYITKKLNAKTYQAVADISNHKETGIYTFCFYSIGTTHNVQLAKSGIVIDGIKAKASIVDQDKDNGLFTVQVSDIQCPADVTAVDIAVWSDANGRDDMKVYKAVKSGDVWTAKVDFADHKFDTGSYTASVYATDRRGIRMYTCGTTVNVPTPKVTVTSKLQVNTVTLTIKNLLNASNVSALVWGNADGSADKRIYTPEQIDKRTYTVSIPLINHMETGPYTVQIYATVDGARKAVAVSSFTVDELKNIIQITDQDDDLGTFKVSIYGAQASREIAELYLAVWTDKNGQDDLYWHKAELIDGVYSCTVDSAKHKSESGRYQVHAYAFFEDESREFLCGTTADVKRTARAYQNPEGYYQIQDSITLSGGGYNLSYGFEGLKVAWVIKRLGVNGGNYVGLYANIFGPKTTAAVQNFQRSHGLPVTGTVDLTTWLAMGGTEADWYTNLSAYVSPLYVNKKSTRSDHIEAMINRAYEYMGTPYVIGASGAPGTGVDCSGLVMQALYSAGIDMNPINPVRHAHPGYEYESANIWASSQMLHISESNMQRGDLVIYQNSAGEVIHVAIYLGDGNVIEATCEPFNAVVVKPLRNAYRANIKGILRPFQ